jgi:hypothetical protein
MEPALRNAYVDMMPRLEAQKKILWAQIVRVANYAKDDYESQMRFWEQMAQGAVIGEHIDPRGRPMTDSLSDFVGFWKGDTRMLQKYGQV